MEQPSLFHTAANYVTAKRQHDCGRSLLRTIAGLLCNVAKCVPLLVQQNMDGSNFFNRSWAEFRVGFSDLRGNYWLGNERLHRLTTSGRYKLRFDLQALNHSWYYTEYSSLSVFNETSNYKIRVSGYQGNAGDALWYSDGKMFTTFDRDNDRRSVSDGNCAVRTGGGFWHSNCTYCGVNVIRGRPDDFKWRGRLGTQNVAITLNLQSSRMWLTC